MSNNGNSLVDDVINIFDKWIGTEAKSPNNKKVKDPTTSSEYLTKLVNDKFEAKFNEWTDDEKNNWEYSLAGILYKYSYVEHKNKKQIKYMVDCDKLLVELDKEFNNFKIVAHEKADEYVSEYGYSIDEITLDGDYPEKCLFFKNILLSNTSLLTDRIFDVEWNGFHSQHFRLLTGIMALHKRDNPNTLKLEIHHSFVGLSLYGIELPEAEYVSPLLWLFKDVFATYFDFKLTQDEYDSYLKFVEEREAIEKQLEFDKSQKTRRNAFAMLDMEIRVAKFREKPDSDMIGVASVKLNDIELIINDILIMSGETEPYIVMPKQSNEKYGDFDVVKIVNERTRKAITDGILYRYYEQVKLEDRYGVVKHKGKNKKDEV